MALMDISSQITALPVWLLLLITAWTLAWKGIALWKSARLKQPVWFIIMLVINTLGILEIVYIFIFSRMGFDHLRARKEIIKPKR